MNNELNKTRPNLNIDTSDKDINTISQEILLSKDPEKNYYAAISLVENKIRHLQVVIESKDPLWNYKCVKHCTKTPSLTIEEKRLLIAVHTQVVLHSNNQDIINKLNKFLKYNPVSQNTPKIGVNCGKQKKKSRK